MVQMDSLISFCMFLSLNNFTNRSKKKKKKNWLPCLPYQGYRNKKNPSRDIHGCIANNQIGIGKNEEEGKQIACLAWREKKKNKPTLNYILTHLCAFPRTPKGIVKRGDISTYPITNLGKGRACQKAIYSKASKGSGVGVHKGCKNRCSCSAHDPIHRGEDWLIPGRKYDILGSW